MKNKFKKINTWLKFVDKFIEDNPVYLGAFFVFLFGIIWLKPTLNPLSYGHLDPSFVYAVGKAAERGISFGNDFIATYGPLGFITVNFLPELTLKVMAAHILIVLLTGIGVYYFTKLYLKSNKDRLIIGTILLLALSMCTVEWVWLLLNVFIIYIFIYFKANKQTKVILGYALSVAAAVMMLVKFTIGASSFLALFTVVLINQPKTVKWKTRAINFLKLLAVYFVTLTVLAFVLGTNNIFAYLKSAYLMSNGFNNAMSQVDINTYGATKLLFLAFALFCIWVFYKYGRQSIKYLFLLPVFYILWKYSIVRQDGHILTSLQVLLPLTIIFYVIKRKYYDGVFGALVIVITLLSFWANSIPFSSIGQMLTNPFVNVASVNVIKFFDNKTQETKWRSLSDISTREGVISQTMKNTIKNQTVDVYPWEAVTVEVNKLNWENRPSPFSFESYTPEFDQANANFYLQKKADFVLWHKFGTGITGIDERKVIWDEPQALQALLANYHFVSSDDKFILLQKNTQKTKPINDFKEVKTVKANTWVQVPETSGLLCVDVEIQSTLRQSLRTFTTRQRPFYMFVKYENGDIEKVRFIRETAVNGLLVSSLPRDWNDLVNFVKDNNTGSKVDSVKILDEPSATISFKNCNYEKH